MKNTARVGCLEKFRGKFLRKLDTTYYVHSVKMAFHMRLILLALDVKHPRSALNPKIKLSERVEKKPMRDESKGSERFAENCREDHTEIEEKTIASKQKLFRICAFLYGLNEIPNPSCSYVSSLSRSPGYCVTMDY